MENITNKWNKWDIYVDNCFLKWRSRACLRESTAKTTEINISAR